MRLVLFDDGSDDASAIWHRLRDEGMEFQSIPSDEFALAIDGASYSAALTRYDAHRLIRDVVRATSGAEKGEAK